MKDKIYLLLVICVLVLRSTLFAINGELKFKHITSKDGLSLNSVHSFKQDYKGFIWIATRDGLNKYDGIEFIVFRNISSDNNSIGGNDVNMLLEDSERNLWVGVHQGGLNLYNRETNDFTVYKHHSNDSKSIQNDLVNDIVEDESLTHLWVATGDGLSLFDKKTRTFENYKMPVSKNGGDNWINDILNLNENYLLLATRKGGLVKFDKKRRKFVKYYKHDELSPETIGANGVYCLYQDKRKNIWVGTLSAGLDKFDLKTEEFTHFSHDPNEETTLSDNTVFAIQEDLFGRLWVGTEHGGLNLYNRESGHFKRFMHNENDDYSLSQNSVQGIDLDQEGNLWVSTYAGGLSILLKRQSPFIHYENIPSKSNSLSNNNILGMLLDSKNRFWVATDGGGLNLSVRNNNTFKQFKHYNNDPRSIGGNAVLEIYEDKQGRVWAGTYGGGIALYNEYTDDFDIIMHDADDFRSLGGNVIGAFQEDRKGRFWVGTWLNGLDLFDRETREFKHYKKKPGNTNSLIGYHVNAIYEDTKGMLWIGTHQGLSVFDPDKEIFKNYVHDENQKGSISHSTVTSTIQDNDGNYWVATWGGGLNLYDPETDTFKSFKKEDGLPNNVIYEILKDKEGFLWLSTNHGLSKFDTKKRVFKNYDRKDGILGDQFFYGSSFQDKQGYLYFGSTEGLNKFKPEDITENLIPPSIVFTNFTIFNQSVPVGSSELPKHINELTRIELEWKQSVFTISFAALNFNQPEENQYAYRMIGFEDDYNMVGNKHSATYTNLDPGSYQFHVKASNNDGVWNEKGEILEIVILPPFWMTWWFRFLVGFLIVSIAFYVIRRRISLIKERNEELERLVQIRTAEVVNQKEEIESQKDQLELKNKQITDSISYAQTIQNAILPNEDLFKSFFEDYFILYRQKDIVSGDFYWMSKTIIDDTEYVFVAAVDCTGHGVPGAFMSMIGSRLLNLIVNEQFEKDPKKILEKLHAGIVHALDQKKGSNNDGMDVAFARLEYKGKQVEVVFTGAKRPLYYTSGDGDLQTLKADRRSIGGNYLDPKPFTNSEIVLEKGDLLYLSSDGLIDQNNNERKKFGTKKLVETMNSLKSKDLSVQKQELEIILDEHQSGTEQRDDITFLGIRV